MINDYVLKLKDFEIVIVTDDSGSMSTVIDKTQHTRWNELREMVKIITEMGTIFDKNGVDICFLNRPEARRIKDCELVNPVFNEIPNGYTPVVPVLENIFTSNLAKKGGDKKLLVFVATDGQPTNDEGNEDLSQFEQTMHYTRNQETTFVSFLLCTDVPEYAELFGYYDESMKNVDVTDDYETEKAKFLQHSRLNYRFDNQTKVTSDKKTLFIRILLLCSACHFLFFFLQ